MNNPGAKRNSSLENDVLRCCIFLQRVIEKELEGDEKYADDVAHGATGLEETVIEGQVIDATTTTTTNGLEADGKMVRRVGKGPVIKSAKVPKDVQSLKRLQEYRNKEILKAKKGNTELDKEI